MIALRDILIFAGLAMIAAVFIAALFPVREGVSPVPACSDCAFKLTGPYSIVQYGNYAAIQLGARQVARYGWAYVDGQPLRPGDASSCHPRPMYLRVIGGFVYASCSDDVPPTPNRWRRSGIFIDTGGLCATGCVRVYAQNDTREAYVPIIVNYSVFTYVQPPFGYPSAGSESGITPLELCLPRPYGLLPFGVFHFTAVLANDSSAYADAWVEVARGPLRISGVHYAVVPANDTGNYRRSGVFLKVIPLHTYWEAGYSEVKIYLADGRYVEVSRGAEYDFLLAFEDCASCSKADYADEVWRIWYDGAYQWLLAPLITQPDRDVVQIPHSAVKAPGQLPAGVMPLWMHEGAVSFTSTVDNAYASVELAIPQVCR
mgnify:CR=1 FL=1